MSLFGSLALQAAGDSGLSGVSGGATENNWGFEDVGGGRKIPINWPGPEIWRRKRAFAPEELLSTFRRLAAEQQVEGILGNIKRQQTARLGNVPTFNNTGLLNLASTGANQIAKGQSMNPTILKATGKK